MRVPLLSLEKRKTTFNEVELGFTLEEAINEANRCIQCKNPKCVEGCPAKYKSLNSLKHSEKETQTKQENNKRKQFFPSICGRICQHEKQCEGHCILNAKNDPISIGGIERYIGDNTVFPERETKNGKKIAVIGSGPSGLTVAALLSLQGMNVTVMEGTNTFGGVIKYGVPEFRLPKEIVARKLAGLHDLEIDFEPNVKIDADILEEMVKNYDAVFMGTGVGKPKMLTNEGHELKGIMNAMKFLVNLNQSALPMISPGEKVVVVGAGYVGLDAARSAIRLGGKVTCITMATKEESYAAVVEKDYLEAEEEGVKFIFGVQVEKFEGNEHVEKVHYKNSESGVLEADKVIIAIGQQHDNESLKNIIKIGPDGCILVNKNKQTIVPNLFAAGDCVHGPKTVIAAITAGREAAKAIIKYLDKKDMEKAEAEQRKLIEEAIEKQKTNE